MAEGGQHRAGPAARAARELITHQGLSRERLARFLGAMAAADRRQRRPWVSDEDVVSGINGYARCISVTEKRPIELTHVDYSWALQFYRRRRGLKRRPDRSSTPLLHVA